jgi:hypothetical protein
VPVVGFIDDNGEQIAFAGIVAGLGEFALPRPVVVALSRGYRAADHYGSADVVSVTTLINPIRQTRLMQRNEIYVKPLDNMWAVFGTVCHSLLEDAATVLPELVTERRLVIERDGQLIGGTFDLIELDDDLRIGSDYKVTSAYAVASMIAQGVRKAKPEYYKQANLYRLMIADPAAREVIPGLDPQHPLTAPFALAGTTVDRWQIVAWARDFKADRGSEVMSIKPYGARTEVGLSPIELIDVPLGKPDGVEQYLRERLVEYKASAMCDDDGLPHCTDEETWNGRRCAKYCNAAGVCSQFNATKRRKK